MKTIARPYRRRMCELLTTLLAVALPALAHAAEPIDVLTGYTATLWADVDGHPIGSVTAITQDRDGYLWIGATAGLFRFDGVRFTAWSQIGDTPLPTTWVSSLRTTADGSLWVGFGDRPTLARVRGRSAERLSLPGMGGVAGIVEDREGALWVVAGYALFRVEGTQWTQLPLTHQPAALRVHDVTIARSGSLLLSTERGVFERRVGATDFTPVVDGYIWSAEDDRDGRMWVTDTRAGFRLIVGGQPSPIVSTTLGGGYRVLPDRSGYVWIGTIAEGLWRVHVIDTKAIVQKATLRSALFNDAVQSLFEDRDGNIWVGTTAGLHRLHQQLLQTIPTDGIVSAIDGSVPNELWAGTPFGLVRLKPNEGGWAAAMIQKTVDIVRNVARDSKGVVWLGAGEVERLGRYAHNRLEWLRVPSHFHLLTRGGFLAVDTADAVWLGDGSQVLVWNGTTFSVFAPRVDDATPPIRFVYPDSQGRIWVAFVDGRLGVRESSGQFHVFAIDTLPVDRSTILWIAEGSNGRIWAATSNGIIRIAGYVATAITRKNGLPADQVWTVVEDGEGMLWADVGAGVIRIPPDEVDRVAGGSTSQVRYEFFDASDGLSGAPTIVARAGRTSDGKVWFVRSGALTLIDPQRLRDTAKHALAPVVIDNIRANERTYAARPALSLTAGTTRIEIEYTTVALSQSTRLRYRYRLDGVDSTWVAAGVRRAAVYTNLSPGAYRFVVQAGSDEDGWHATPTSYEFEIRPAFYQTRAFLYAAVLLAALLVLTVWRFRVGLVRREYAAVLAERMRLSREIHDTLLQGVVGVALQLDNVSHDRGMPRASKARLEDMRDEVEAYIREARQSIFELRSPLLEEHDLVGALREVGRRATTNTDVRFVVNVSGQPKRYAARVENELLRIAQEAVTNAVRHAQATHISLVVRFEPERVSVEVSDDGRGLATAADAVEASHIGLASMKERAESLGGRVTIRRSPEGGTAIEATLPIQSAA